MALREMLYCPTALLLGAVLGCSFALSIVAAEQCSCSDIRCITRAVEIHNSSASGDQPECCMWDFPPNLAVGFTTVFEKLGYAFGRTTKAASSFCISYPVPDASLDLKSYFLVKLDLKGPDVCISEPERSENKSCSAQLRTVPVKKATYCSGSPVTGVKLVNFTIDCLNCSEKYFADFQFRVYSEAFNTTQENWCDNIDRSVPSESYLDPVKQDDEDIGKETRTDEESTTEEESLPTDGDNSGAYRAGHVLPTLTLLTLTMAVLTA